MKLITPCLWFDHQAEEAAAFYTSVIRNSRILRTTRYGKEGFDVHHQPEGSVMTVEFELNGQPFVALNGGPIFQFSEAISFEIPCETQAEVDEYWEKLTQGGDEKAQQCGWLKDKYGVSWQIVPTAMDNFLHGPDPAGCGRAMTAMLKMKKLDLRELKKAYEGKNS